MQCGPSGTLVQAVGMMTIAWLLAIATACPLLYWAAECTVGLMPVPPRADTDEAPAFTVLIPAHDEMAGIGRTIASVKAQLRCDDRVIVVADNCSDDTAQIARAAGAEVIERSDPVRRGKAYALDVGRFVLRRNPSDVVIILDADCWPEADALRLLASTACRHDAAVQGRYLLQSSEDASPVVRISTFAFLIKNSLRQRGLYRLCGTALLQGTGMAFPWRIFDTAPLVTASLVEDLKLGLDLALSGQAVRFQDLARFTSRASSQRATVGQRTRWEHGMLSIAAHYVPRLLWQGLRGNPSLLFLAANLCVPPFLLLISLTIIFVSGLAVDAMLTGAVAPFSAALIASLAAVAALWAAWSCHGRSLVPPEMLPRLGRYWLWKVPVYAQFLARRQREWVRTERG